MGRPKGSKNKKSPKTEKEVKGAEITVPKEGSEPETETESAEPLESVKRLPPVRPYKKKTIDDLPRAVPSGTVLNTATAMAKVTTSKYIIDRWCTLTRGKSFTAPRRIIGILRQHDLVE